MFKRPTSSRIISLPNTLYRELRARAIAQTQLARLMILYGLLALPNLALAADAGFNCTKAASQIEQLICADDTLAEQDKQMGHLVTTLKQHFNTERRKTFLQGQRVWLKLRDEACAFDAANTTPEDQIKCLHSVYEARVQELTELSQISPATDIDRLLDSSADLNPYRPEGMVMLHISGSDGGNMMQRPAPQTCRELYVLTAGAWEYQADNIGDNAHTTAIATCGFKIFSAQNRVREKETAEIDFADFAQYSNEFSCLSGWPGCRDLFPQYPVTFREEEQQGRLKIWGMTVQNAAQTRKSGEDDLILSIRKSQFSIAGMNNTVHQIATGDFTRRGRQEALLQITLHPDQGTYRGNFLVLAYYDKTHHMIRPELVEAGSRLIMKTTALPASYYHERE